MNAILAILALMSGDERAALAEEAKQRGVTISNLLTQIVRDWLLLNHELKEIHFTPVEQSLLKALAQGFGEPVAKSELKQRAWQYEVEDNRLVVYMSRLRRKLEKTNHEITSHKGAGYSIAKT